MEQYRPSEDGLVSFLGYFLKLTVSSDLLRGLVKILRRSFSIHSSQFEIFVQN